MQFKINVRCDYINGHLRVNLLKNKNKKYEGSGH